jgi:hypothetical protein
MSKTDTDQPRSRTGLLQIDPRTSAAIRNRLGEQLRAMYGTSEEETLPESLLTLAKQFDQPGSKATP